VRDRGQRYLIGRCGPVLLRGHSGCTGRAGCTCWAVAGDRCRGRCCGAPAGQGEQQGQGGDGQRDGRLDREQRHGQANLNRMGGVLHLLNAMVRQWRLSGHATADGNIIQQRVSSVNDAAFHWYTIRATIIMRHSLMVELQLRLRKAHDDGVVLIFNSHQY